MRLIDADEILKRKADVYDKNGHLLLTEEGKAYAERLFDSLR